MIQLSRRTERLLLLFPLACAVIAAFGESVPLPFGDGVAAPRAPASTAAFSQPHADTLAADTLARHDVPSLLPPCSANCPPLSR